MKSRRTTANRRRSGRGMERHQLMELSVRAASERRRRRSKAMGFLWKVSAVLIVLALLALGVRFLALRFFFHNHEYDLKHLVTNLHGVLSEEELGDLTGLKPGKNILILDLGEASRRLSALPEVRSVNIERRLPDTVEVGIERRLPIFHLATGPVTDPTTTADAVPGTSLLCDRDGVVMQPANIPDEFLRLPVLEGIDTSSLKPGGRIDDANFRNATALSEALADLPEETFRVVSLDVSKPYAVVVTDSSGARFTFGTKDLPAQIDRLRKLLSHCQESGRRIATANLATTRNTPVTFVLTPEERSAKIEPEPSQGKKPAKH